MVGIAIAIGWVFNDWGRIRLGWLNQVLGPADGRYAKAGEDGTLRLHSQSDDAGRVVHISWDWGLDGFRNSDRVDVGGVQPAVGLYLRSRNP